MIVIKLNGKNLEVTASEERVLRILKRNNFAAKKAEFVEGSSPRYQNTILPKLTRRQKDLGVYVSENLWEMYSTLGKNGIIATNEKVPWSRRLAFFRENPRCQSGIFGNPRRINAILKRLDAQLDEQIRQENENEKRYDEQRANNLDYNWRNN
jgi:hypothetical protein|tara:strand:- start:185 stop:643 length:459 start_codon:yes stop_codon:yes gene_type:complete